MFRKLQLSLHWQQIPGEAEGVQYAVDDQNVYVRVPDVYFLYVEYGPVMLLNGDLRLTICSMLSEVRGRRH